jgi:hypothetical protein
VPLVDTLIWDSDGAQVIATTENLIEEITSHGTTDLLCDGAEAVLATEEGWAGRAAAGTILRVLMGSTSYLIRSGPSTWRSA